MVIFGGRRGFPSQEFGSGAANYIFGGVPSVYPNAANERFVSMQNIISRAATVAVAALTVIAAPAAHAQNLVTNGSFEQQVLSGIGLSYFAGSTALTGWTVGGAIDHVRTLWQPADGDQSVDLSALTVGSISQSLATIPGDQYAITFAMAGNPEGAPTVKSMDISFGTTALPTQTFSTAGTSVSNMGWETRTFFVTATTANTTLTFTSLTANFGPALDNVSVVVVPEAGTLALLGVGCSVLSGVPPLMGVVVRRRFATGK